MPLTLQRSSAILNGVLTKNFYSSFIDVTNTISILMHQMRISTNQVSSVMLKSKKLEIQKKKCENCERADQTQTECHEIQPNTSKYRAMPEGDNPSF
jgi:hypothetical protein